ncbi:MAG: Cu(I)-responsive transcriptional regulator [Devosiaceae bacterium]|nr:Cu(I)-responsive transcriptional regulator [Devosiaceae bacterium]
MNIGTASEKAGLRAKTIRYYEEIELVTPERSANGYRNYSQIDVHKLQFIQRARSLGFSVDECRQLLALYEDKSRASADVRALARTKLKEVERKLVELHEIQETLAHLVENCHGDNRPDCPILANLSDGKKDIL